MLVILASTIVKEWWRWKSRVPTYVRQPLHLTHFPSAVPPFPLLRLYSFLNPTSSFVRFLENPTGVSALLVDIYTLDISEVLTLTKTQVHCQSSHPSVPPSYSSHFSKCSHHPTHHSDLKNLLTSSILSPSHCLEFIKAPYLCRFYLLNSSTLFSVCKIAINISI